MPSYRIDRISEDIKRDLPEIFRGVKDPRVSGLISVVRVEVSSDLSYAKIFISAVEGIETAKKSCEGLKAASGYIRHRLGSSKSLHLRKVPELIFVADDSIEKGMKLFDKIRNIEKSKED